MEKSQNFNFTSFDDFVKFQNKMDVVIMEEDMYKSTCTCCYFLRNYICIHILSIPIINHKYSETKLPTTNTGLTTSIITAPNYIIYNNWHVRSSPPYIYCSYSYPFIHSGWLIRPYTQLQQNLFCKLFTHLNFFMFVICFVQIKRLYCSITIIVFETIKYIKYIIFIL